MAQHLDEQQRRRADVPRPASERIGFRSADVSGIDTDEILAFPGSTATAAVDYIDAEGNLNLQVLAGPGRPGLRAPATTSSRCGRHPPRPWAEIALPGRPLQHQQDPRRCREVWRPQPGAGPADCHEFRLWRFLRQRLRPRSLCYTAPTPPDHREPEPTGAAAPTDPCLTTSPYFDRTVTATGLPFFENFDAGGIAAQGKVRGFDNTLGQGGLLGSASASRSGWLFLLAGRLKGDLPETVRQPGRGGTGRRIALDSD